MITRSKPKLPLNVIRRQELQVIQEDQQHRRYIRYLDDGSSHVDQETFASG